MVKSKRAINATADEALNPPAALGDRQVIAKIMRAEGSNLWAVDLPEGGQLLVELPSRFRSTFWLKRGGFVVVDTSTLEDRQNKIKGKIVNIVGDEKSWRKQAYWSVFSWFAHHSFILTLCLGPCNL